MSSSGQWSPLQAPSLQHRGTPKQQAPSQHIHGTLIPLLTAAFCCQPQLKSSSPVSAPMIWKRPETGQANCGVRQWCHAGSGHFSSTPSGWRVQKTGYLWNRFLGMFYCQGGRISCLTRQSSIGSHSKWTFTFPSLKNIFGQTEFSHNFIMLSTQTSGNWLHEEKN